MLHSFQTCDISLLLLSPSFVRFQAECLTEHPGMRVQFTTDGGGTEQSRKTEGEGMPGFLLLLLQHLHAESCGELSGQSQVPASAPGEGQNGIIRPVQDPSSPHAAGHPSGGQPPLGQRVPKWSDWAEVPHKPSVSYRYIETCFQEGPPVGHHVGF